MLPIPANIAQQYDAMLERYAVEQCRHIHYRKWLRFYLDFCRKYGFGEGDKSSFQHYNNKLREKNQPESLRRQAHHAVKLYFRMMADFAGNETFSEPHCRTQTTPAELSSAVPHRGVSQIAENPPGWFHSNPVKGWVSVGASSMAELGHWPDEGHISYKVAPANLQQTTTPVPSVNETIVQTGNPQAGMQEKGVSWVGCYEQLESTIKTRHYSPKTLSAYRTWVRKLQTFVLSKDPGLLCVDDVKRFLSYLAVERGVSASSQNQAFNALLFLFRHVLGKDFGKLEGVVRAKRKP